MIIPGNNKMLVITYFSISVNILHKLCLIISFHCYFFEEMDLTVSTLITCVIKLIFSTLGDRKFDCNIFPSTYCHKDYSYFS